MFLDDFRISARQHLDAAVVADEVHVEDGAALDPVLQADHLDVADVVLDAQAELEVLPVLGDVVVAGAVA